LSPEAAQDSASLLGKIVRLDVDRTDPEPIIVAMGLRNPWRFSFDRETGDLFIGDVGESAWEEIDVVRRGTRGVPNFGWGGADGTGAPAYVRYRHGSGCAAVIGGFVYRGRTLPTQRGRYFYGDTCSGAVWSVRARVTTPRPRREPIGVGQLVSFGEDASGQLYLVSRGSGTLFRLTSTD
jgi:glucose/arabinose dehydrogenase